MLQEVINQLPGKNKQEVIELLGKQPDEFTVRHNFSLDSTAGQDFTIYLGYSRTVNPGEEWLLIWFDKNGNFEKYRIVTTVA
jgi:hypothetical protein